MLPYLRAKPGRFQDVSALREGRRQGRRRKIRQSAESRPIRPGPIVATVDGKIVASNTQSRAATIDVDVDGDGKADVRVQIGPAMRGTALRDALDFVDFNEFTNQIDFAQFGKAFNTYVNNTVLSKLPRDGLDGKTVKMLGAYRAGKRQRPAAGDAGRSRDRAGAMSSRATMSS